VRRAVLLLAAAAASVIAGGVVIAATWHVSFGHGLYCSLGTASTVGCDKQPVSPAGWIAAAAVMLTAIPLLAAAFGSLHLDKVRAHVADSEHRMKAHFEQRLREHLGSKGGGT
jgi:hypothetical protein